MRKYWKFANGRSRRKKMVKIAGNQLRILPFLGYYSYLCIKSLSGFYSNTLEYWKTTYCKNSDY